MRALRSSPSLTAACGPASVDPVRRHTTDEAAHPFDHGHWQQSRLEQGPIPEQATPPYSTAPSSSSNTLGLSNTPSDGQPLSSASAGSNPQDEAPMAAISGLGSSAATDLLGFAAEKAAKQSGFAGVGGLAQQANGKWSSGDSCNLGHSGGSILVAEPQGSVQLQHAGSVSDGLTFSQTVVPPMPVEPSADDPFLHSATLSAILSQSSKQLSGLSMLAESQASDIDSWGSFHLPDASSNMAADVDPERPAGSAEQTPGADSGVKKGLDAFPLSLVLGQAADSQSVQAADTSSNACITNKQRLQLDLFLQSSTGAKQIAG